MIAASPVSVSLLSSLAIASATAAIQGYKVPVASVMLCHRAAYIHALTLGQTAQEYDPEGRAAQEINELYKWTCKQVKV